MKADTLRQICDKITKHTASHRTSMTAVLVVVLACWISSSTSEAQQPFPGFGRQRNSQTATSKESKSENGAAEKRVSLNHFHASWKSVLEKFAAEVDCQLVMPDLPPGHFSRRDSNQYSIADGIRILNSELEKKGFQVSQRGNYLLVLDQSVTKSRYPQPVIPQNVTPQNVTPQSVAPTAVTTQPDSHTAQTGQFAAQSRQYETAENRSMRRPDALAANNLQHARPDQQTPIANDASFQQSSSIQHSDYHSPTGMQPLESVPELLRIFRIPTGNQNAALIAQKVYAVCATRAILLQPNADQLLAYRIHFSQTDDRQTRIDQVITVWVDKSDRELTIECPSSIVEPIQRLVQTVAATPAQDGAFVELISVAGDATATGTKVRSSLAKVSWQQTTEELPQGQAATQTQSADQRAIIEQIRGNVEVVTIDELGVIILQGTDNDVAAVKQLISEIEKAARTELQMRIVPLKNARADDLALVINQAIQSVIYGNSPTGAPTQSAAQPAASTGGQMKIATSVMLQFLSNEGVKSGILVNIQVSSDPRTNSLLVSAPQHSMAMISSLVRQLDIPAPTVSDIKVFTLSNGDARDMARLLDSLFASPTQQQTGVQLAGAVEASTHLVPMRFTVDARTNSIIAKGSSEALRVAEAVLLRLDQNDLRQRRNHVFRLRNNLAPELAEAINAFLGSKRDLAQSDPQLVSTIEQIEQEVIVVAEPITNSLLISSTPRYFEEIQALVEQLDQPAAQVNIQVLLVEVELDSNDEFGIELGIQDPVLFQRSVIDDLVTITTSQITPLGVPVTSEKIVSQTSTPGFLFNNRPLGNNTTVRPSAVGSQGLSNFSLGRSNSSLGYGGLVLSASSEAVSVLVRALAARRNVHILSRPQIRTLDNQLAQIQVGQQVPIVDGVTISQNNAATPLIRQDKAGIIMTVTPRISPDGTVVMEVIAEKSQFAGENVPLFVNSDGSTVESPVKNITTAKATVSVPNGQTIVLGGMITKVDVTDERKVPILGDIPLLGRAFRYDSSSTKRTELLMFLTPRVIRDPFESESIKRVEADRMHYFVEEAEKIHGPLFSIPETLPYSEPVFEEFGGPNDIGLLPPVISVDQP
jgi:type II secretion system protein D